MTCHDDLFTDHRSEVDGHVFPIYLMDVVRIIERVNMHLPGPVKSSNINIMFLSFILNSGMKFFKYHIHRIIESDNLEIELKRGNELDIFIVSVENLSRKREVLGVS